MKTKAFVLNAEGSSLDEKEIKPVRNIHIRNHVIKMVKTCTNRIDYFFFLNSLTYIKRQSAIFLLLKWCFGPEAGPSKCKVSTLPPSHTPNPKEQNL